MSYESIKGIDLVFRETFNSYSDILKNGGTLTDVTLSNGEGDFNGTSSKIEYPTGFDFDRAWTIRTRFVMNNSLKFRIISKQNKMLFTVGGNYAPFMILYGGTNENDGAGRTSTTLLNSYEGQEIELVATYDGSGTVDGNHMKIYLNGNRIDTDNYVFGAGYSAINNSNNVFVGYRNNDTTYADGQFDLVEFYDYDMSADEVSAMYKNILYTEPSKTGEVLNVNARNGVIKDDYNNTITNTDVTVYKDNDYVMKCNNSSSEITIANYTALNNSTTNTIAFWMKSTSTADNEYLALRNGATIAILIDDSVGDGGIRTTFYDTEADLQRIDYTTNINDDLWKRVVVVNNGTTQYLYINGIEVANNTAASYDSGIRTVSSATLYIGGDSVQGRYGDCLLNDFEIILDAWSAEEVARDYNANKGRYE